MDSHSGQQTAFEVHHTVITVIEGVDSEADAEAVARRMLETRPVDRLDITEGAEVFRGEVQPVPVAAARGRG
jgi:hypothetical protein